jgi:hypothetical protein
LIVLSALVAVSCGDQAPRGWVANSQARSMARGIDPADVNRVEVSGPYLSLPPGSGDAGDWGAPQVVTDRARIAAIIGAFRASRRRDEVEYEPGGTGSGPDIFRFVFANRHEPVFFEVTGHGDINRQYGPEVERMYESFRQRPRALFNSR